MSTNKFRLTVMLFLCVSISFCTVVMAYTITSQRKLSVENCESIERIKSQIRAGADRSNFVVPSLEIFKGKANQRDLKIILRQNREVIRQFAAERCR